MIELQRKEFWLSAFHDAVEEVRRTPFSWDGHDCATGLAARMVHALTGVDFAAEWRGLYSDAPGAFRTMRRAGFETLADVAARYLPEYGHSSEAHMGDIAAIEDDSQFGHVLGVFNKEQILVLTENGLGWSPRHRVVRSFRVGVV